MKEAFKKTICLLVGGLIIFGSAPLCALAEENNKDASGSIEATLISDAFEVNIPESIVTNASTAIPTYRTHVQNEGWQGWKNNGEVSGTSGKGLRLEGIQIMLANQGSNLGVEYCTHVENIGWQEMKSDGVTSGTSGQGLRLEAIRINLTGTDAGNYDIYYQVHAENIGWLDWGKNGESAGTEGLGFRLEAINIVVVPKGSAAPGPTAKPFVRSLTKAEFLSKIYGVWYKITENSKYKYQLIFISNKSFVGETYGFGSAGGLNYEVVKTTQNGGTIKIPVFQCPDSTRPNEGVVFVDFDFGEPNDNKLSYHTYGELWGNRVWSEDYTAAEVLGNNQYRLPFEIYVKNKLSNIVEIWEWKPY